MILEAANKKKVDANREWIIGLPGRLVCPTTTFFESVFFHMPASVDTPSNLILRAIAEGIYPANLWKYRPNNPFTDDIFQSQALYFPYPPQLNDPFDCQIQPVNCTPAEVTAFVQQNNAGRSNSDIRAMVAEATRDPAAFRRSINDSMRKSINRVGVCSFTTNFDNLLMWAHYTESHKGLCLGFDVTQDPELFDVPLIVQYAPTYPVYNHLTDSSQLAYKVLATKSDHWTYEEEVRVMKIPMPPNQKMSFNPLVLREVLFGCNMSADERQRIKQLAKNNGFGHTIFKRAVISSNSYALTFVPC